ncbi:imidazolonepropionase [Hydromonas duriensis]|uniref:Imidazolonepropionase n=1 Tax=Hydromonas duriensis TaxID=1527608 RepID=A0A4R6YBC2_9BURK|nr:imidazolonepropionase [Hydromonas duriensis]TDR32856.1 imidazolonepropionase [Hydromonas duriensis]
MPLIPTHEWDCLWLNVHLATMKGESYGEIRDAAIAIKDKKIAWLGAQSDLPDTVELKRKCAQILNGKGLWVTPGLIDCHTHIVYAGNRSHEFEARLNGASYEDIAQAGGGILSTVNATRDATFDELLNASLPRIKRLLAEGVTTLEIKSGYGLTIESEANILRVARHIDAHYPVNVRTTFLGAHAIPPEYKGRADDYITFICEDMLPALHAEGLVDAVDAFCERIGFSAAQTERVFKAATQLGLPVKLHAEQLSNQEGAALVARYKGLSADHLEYLSDDGIRAMAEQDVTAVLLPGAYYFLRETQLPPIQALRDAGVSIAVATDCNPGTSPMTSILLAMNMACTLFKLTPQEALAGVTINAAKALGMQDQVGSLEVGKAADFTFWDIDRPADLAYAMGQNACVQVIKTGLQIVE